MLQPAFSLKTNSKTYKSHTFKLLPPSISYGHFIETALRKIPQMKPPKGMLQIDVQWLLQPGQLILPHLQALQFQGTPQRQSAGSQATD